MKICIFGAGAIGGLIGGRLARAGAEVTLIARGANLEALRENGLTVRSGGEEFTVRPPCTDDPAGVGEQDVVFACVKAHALPGIAAAMAPLLGPETAVVSAVNGLPWWYFHKAGGALEGARLEAVDPGGAVWRAIGPARAIACVVWPSARLAAPGVVEHTDSLRLPLGEPDGERSERATALSGQLTAAGFKSPVKPRIRDEIWLKLLGNLALNPVSVLTGLSLGEIGVDAETRATVRAMMEEGAEVAGRLDVRLAMGIEQRLEAATATGDHKTSMLQDFEAGRPLELEEIVGSVIELAGRLEIPVPVLEKVYGEVRARVSEN